MNPFALKEDKDQPTKNVKALPGHEDKKPEVDTVKSKTKSNKPVIPSMQDHEETTEKLFEKLISRMRNDVAKKLIIGAKGGYEKLMGDLDEDTFIEKNFTKIIEMRLNNAMLNNK